MSLVPGTVWNKPVTSEPSRSPSWTPALWTPSPQVQRKNTVPSGLHSNAKSSISSAPLPLPRRPGRVFFLETVNAQLMFFECKVNDRAARCFRIPGLPMQTMFSLAPFYLLYAPISYLSNKYMRKPKYTLGRCLKFGPPLTSLLFDFVLDSS